MGFSEDDRIRSKNRLHNSANEHYEELRSKYMGDGDIIDFLEAEIRSSIDDDRNEIYETVIKIARSRYAKGNSQS
jgi:hypothetical protein